jgi:SAM-dependent methyltransferase
MYLSESLHEVNAMAADQDFHTVTIKELGDLFSLPTTTIEHDSAVVESLERAKMRPGNIPEREEYILEFVNRIRNPRIARDDEENLEAWNKGWQENLDEIRAHGLSEENVKPRYFRGSKFFRFRKDLWVTDNPQLEYDLFVACRRLIFSHFLSDASQIVELGCGSCGNLYLLSRLFPDKHLKGHDWATPSVELANEIGMILGRDIRGERLDFLNPPETLGLEPGAAVISIHALEQIGNRHEKLLGTLLRSKPSVVLHYEPILELYDQANLYDNLAAWYTGMRNYLSGLLDALKELERQGRIEILKLARPEIGGVMHESSLVVWRPL